MPIPSSQLETWTHQGAVVSSAAAYASIQHALSRSKTPLESKSIEVYLQGSYRNSTNIFGDSDVDVVVELSDLSFERDLSRLTPTEVAIHHHDYSVATYLWTHFRQDTLATLQFHYGTTKAFLGPKSIKVVTGAGRPSDVIPVLPHRIYHQHLGRRPGQEKYTQGIQFQTDNGQPIINFPKLHIANGENKNRDFRTGGTYKSTVRMFKNARNAAIDRNLLATAGAPSYFVECLLYNVPDASYTSSASDAFVSVVNYLAAADLSVFDCQNGQTKLFGSLSTQWDVASAKAFVSSLVRLWDEWYY
jgi:hypothetical protein